MYSDTLGIPDVEFWYKDAKLLCRGEVFGTEFVDDIVVWDMVDNAVCHYIGSKISSVSVTSAWGQVFHFKSDDQIKVAVNTYVF